MLAILGSNSKTASGLEAGRTEKQPGFRLLSSDHTGCSANLRFRRITQAAIALLGSCPAQALKLGPNEIMLSMVRWKQFVHCRCEE